jgi:hypothetical protein
MSFGSPFFVIAIVALSMGAWVITTWIRAKHGYPMTDDYGNVIQPRDAGPDAARQIELLSNENSGLKGQVTRLEERIAVLERIATDPAERTAREIEKLR